MFKMGTQELIIIFLIIVLLFGATRLPQLGQSLGSAIRNFKKGFSADDAAPPPPQQQASSNLPQGGSNAPVSQDDKQKQG